MASAPEISISRGQPKDENDPPRGQGFAPPSCGRVPHETVTGGRLSAPLVTVSGSSADFGFARFLRAFEARFAVHDVGGDHEFFLEFHPLRQIEHQIEHDFFQDRA